MKDELNKLNDLAFDIVTNLNLDFLSVENEFLTQMQELDDVIELESYLIKSLYHEIKDMINDN